MASDPAVSGKDAVKALKKLGFRLDRTEGSHHMLVRPGLPWIVVVPVHGSQALPKGTLKSIIRMARVSRKDFFAAVR
jgi:predicted RNA binding protein YcfA (HicA-like mRNA interferase family)